jgi:hypothetical protein
MALLPLEYCSPPQFRLDLFTINVATINQKAITFDYNLSDYKASVMLVGVNATNANNPVAAANATNVNPPFAAPLQVKPRASTESKLSMACTSTTSKVPIFPMEGNNGGLQYMPRSALGIITGLRTSTESKLSIGGSTFAG